MTAAARLVWRSFFASFAASFLALAQIRANAYFGAPFVPELGDGLEVIILIPIWLIAAVPAFFLVTPITLAASFFLHDYFGRKNWAEWLVTGALLGPVALYLLSFPLGLGRELMLALVLNGATWGAVCATTMRALLHSDIVNTAITTDQETTDNLAIPKN